MNAIILAGGRSARMNEIKALLPLSDVRLIERIAQNIDPYFEEILISAHSRETFEFLPYQVVIDEKLNQGPLMGILSSLRASRSSVNFVIACDIPDINVSFLEKMISFTDKYDIIVPVSGKNLFEPLFAFYNKRIISHIEDLLGQNQKKISNLFQKCLTKYIPLENDGWYHNLNTREDYQNYLLTKEVAMEMQLDTQIEFNNRS